MAQKTNQMDSYSFVLFDLDLFGGVDEQGVADAFAFEYRDPMPGYLFPKTDDGEVGIFRFFQR